ncbi:hypothetical protein MTR67_035157 [Solanum verrucosum]|uniref:Uncharacterized protein n=1 Tax=Solanum verrucosum TaxID=315347 RepID=A0AAF0U9G1_SOLVR|nr:hypothetical protein MTR67_035157 [Solanum verrucosum]
MVLVDPCLTRLVRVHIVDLQVKEGVIDSSGYTRQGSDIDHMCQPLVVPISISTPIGDSLVVDWVYRVFSDIFYSETQAKLILLDMLHFDVILETTGVVREFMDVFPIDLGGVTLDCDIDFVFDLDPGTKPISTSPYRMALMELKNLKAQLEDSL